jgi:DNA-binding CsgD family transcriptional regulator
MPLLSSWLQRLFKKEKGTDDRAFASEVDALEIVSLGTQPAELLELGELEGNRTNEKPALQEFEIFPEDPTVRKQWFSLTIRERQVAALLCMGHRNYEIAAILGVGYPTIQTHLQKIFNKFGLRSRREIREALMSWQAEEWWNYHHY